MKEDRIAFNETWLFESPRQIGTFPTYDGLCQIINSLKKAGLPIQKVKGNLKKIELSEAVYYWYEENDKILLGSELLIKSQALVVRITGKDPALTKHKQPPYASNLYIAILNDTNKAIRLMSDDQLSDEGFKLWRRLYDAGVCVSVYNNASNKPGGSFIWLNSIEDFESYFGKGNISFEQHQYVLSKKGSASLGETLGHFNNRRLRELVGLDLD